MGTSPQINPGLQRTANTEFLKDAGLRNGHSIYPEWSEPSQQHAQVEYLRPQVINLFQISNSLPLWSLPQYSAKRALEPPPTFIGHSFSALALQHFKPDHFFFCGEPEATPSCDNQKCIQTLPNIPWGGKYPQLRTNGIGHCDVQASRKPPNSILGWVPSALHGSLNPERL